jgi:cystathionine beta-lyase/cystathionine gamma-synthase
LVLSSAFSFASGEVAEAAFRGEDDAYIYGRWQNPTVEELERTLAVLEGGEAAVATASGMAAVSGSLLGLLGAGDHVVAPRALYGETARLLRERLVRFGVETTFLSTPSVEAYEAAIGPRTRVLYVESPQNPTLGVTDIAAISALARARGLLTVVDNTFATPACQRPLALGADVVVHSMTKGLCGHGDAIGGAVIARRGLRDKIADTIVKGLGGVLAPFNAFLIARGIRTLGLRAERSTSSALAIARWLAERRDVARVHYPGLESHPDHAIAARQMTAFGSIVSFELVGGKEACRRLVDRVRLVTHAVSLGDVRTLVTHPATTTASTMPEEDRHAVGITDALVRLSVGIEGTRDLIEDLDRALV